jgi:hypothetical protein
MREFALVGAWALSAIAVANWDSHMIIAYTSLVAAMVLVISSSVHGFRNRSTSPFIKLKQILNR